VEKSFFFGLTVLDLVSQGKVLSAVVWKCLFYWAEVLKGCTLEITRSRSPSLLVMGGTFFLVQVSSTLFGFSFISSFGCNLKARGLAGSEFRKDN